MKMSIEVFLDMPAKEEEEANPTLFADIFMFWHLIINIQWINMEIIDQNQMKSAVNDYLRCKLFQN